MEIRLFGTWDITIHGGSLLEKVRRRNDIFLLVLLLIDYPQKVSRAELRETLWPDNPNNTRTLIDTLSRLRRILGTEYGSCILCDRPAQALKLDLAGIRADLIDFDKLIKQGTPQAQADALQLYRGDFMEGCDEFWAVEVRNTYRRKFFELLEQIARGEESTGNFKQAAERWQRIYQAEPLAPSEHALRSHMNCLAKSGQRDEALQAYHSHHDNLTQHASRLPEPETVALYEKLCQPDTAPPADFSIRFIPPVPLTEIIGRQERLENLERFLRQSQTGGCRLITLVGPGGVGKTCLARALAYRMRDTYVNGAAFLKFGGLRPGSSPEDLAAEVTTQLKIPEQTGRKHLETLEEIFRPLSALLVFDNCEHLLVSCAHFASHLLENCPHLRLLVTSRHPLGIHAEKCERVGPLRYPPSADIPEKIAGRAAALGSLPAMQLFVERATARSDAFTLTDENAEDIAAICHRLDGLPLAIELAAGRISSLSPAQIRHKLAEHFLLLTGGETTALERHQTMEAAIAWSYNLLTPPQKEMFARLSVFANGWTLAAAEQVCVNLPEREKASGLLQELLAHSLIQKESVSEKEGVSNETLRFRYLHTIRDYACTCLADSPQAEEFEKRYRRWCLRFAREADSHLRGAELLVWLKRMEPENDNLRAALDWACSEEGNGRFGLELACSLAHFWWVHCHFREGYGRFTALLKKISQPIRESKQDIAELAAKAFVRAGLLAEYTGQSSQAIQWLQNGLDLLRENDGAPLERAYALNMLGFAYHTTDAERSDRLLEEGKALAAEISDVWLLALLHSTQGFVRMFQNKSSQVRSLLEKGLEQAQTVADPWLIGELQYHLGLNALMEQNWEAARGHLVECLPIFDTLSDRLGLCSAHAHLGNILLVIGQEDSACQHWQRSLQMGRSIAYDRGVALSLDGYALFAAKRGDYRNTVRLIFVADAIRHRWQTPRVPFWISQVNACLTCVRDTLGTDTYQSLADESFHLTFEQVQAIISTLTT